MVTSCGSAEKSSCQECISDSTVPLCLRLPSEAIGTRSKARRMTGLFRRLSGQVIAHNVLKRPVKFSSQ